MEGLAEIGFDVPEDVDVAHDQHPCGQPYHAFRPALEGPRKQEQERQHEMEDKQRQSDTLPAAVKAAGVPGDLRWKVSRPGNQQLRETEVGPQHGEG